MILCGSLQKHYNEMVINYIESDISIIEIIKVILGLTLIKLITSLFSLNNYQSKRIHIINCKINAYYDINNNLKSYLL